MKTSTLPNGRSSAGSPFVRILREGAWPALRLLARPDTLAQIPRLFREGIGPAQRLFIQAHNNREMARMIREQVPMTFVSSYLRCGSTWMCYLLCDIILQNKGVRTTTELPFDRKKIILDQYARLIARRDRSFDASGCIIKTHDLIPLLQEQVGGDAGIRECKYLYLYRTPEDALVSTCHLYRREKYLRAKPAYALACRDMDLFCLEFLPGLIEHVESYLDALDEGVDVHLVSYDQLLQRTSDVLSEALRWLGIPHTEATVAHAASNTQFSNLQAMEAKTLGGQIPFFRRGSAGAGALELKPETLSQIRSATRELIQRADERLTNQASRRPAVAAASPFPNEPPAPLGRAEAITASSGR